MQEALQMAVVFFSIVAIVKIISDGRTRKQLIEKGLVDDKAKLFLRGQSEMNALASLKWGMVLVAVGLAAILSQMLDYWWAEEGMFGLMFLFAGVAFLIYYPIAQKRFKDMESRRPE
ncbi:MAG: DUF6249 domain-containing protein [candidate division Zixibacteria bacterium]|nr:DUF6249 domain-containing protein [candidate division Zixibacteria bacterium]